jgi:mercuric ion transport protein
MADDTGTAVSEQLPMPRNTGALVLAVGGLAAAFGAASCCALPLLLGSLGLGSAWLVAVAWVAAPHRVALLAVAIACLVSGASLLLWRRRRIAACTPAVDCRRPAVTALATVVLALGTVLALFGYLYA